MPRHLTAAFNRGIRVFFFAPPHVIILCAKTSKVYRQSAYLGDIFSNNPIWWLQRGTKAEGKRITLGSRPLQSIRSATKNSKLQSLQGRLCLDQGKYPILAMLSRVTLCVPATSAPCERLFSHAGLTIANDRASLLPDNAAEIIYLRVAWDKIEKLRA